MERTYVGVVTARSGPKYYVLSIRVEDRGNDREVRKMNTSKCFMITR
jgi:hypothetical protein